jgi:hypothetical protein
MNINPNGFIANIVFRAEGERKPIGICALLPRFLWQFTLLVWGDLSTQMQLLL